MSERQNTKSSKINWSLPYIIQFELRLSEPPRWYPWAVSGAAIVIALIIGGIIIAIVGGDPFASYAHIARASVGSIGVFSDTLVKATPLILVGLACSLAFRMRLWNIGAEGQFFMGAFGASASSTYTLASRKYITLVIYPCNDRSWYGNGSNVGLYTRFSKSTLQRK